MPNQNENKLRDFIIDENHVLKRYKGRDKIVVVPDGVIAIGTRAFDESNVKEVTLPDSCEVLEEEAFDGCYKLNKVVAPKLKVIKRAALNSCENLIDFEPSYR